MTPWFDCVMGTSKTLMRDDDYAKTTFDQDGLVFIGRDLNDNQEFQVHNVLLATSS